MKSGEDYFLGKRVEICARAEGGLTVFFRVVQDLLGDAVEVCVEDHGVGQSFAQILHGFPQTRVEDSDHAIVRCQTSVGIALGVPVREQSQVLGLTSLRVDVEHHEGSSPIVVKLLQSPLRYQR